MNLKTFRSVTAGTGALTLGIALLATACSGQSTANSGDQHSGGGATVSVHTVNGAALLVDAAGNALYTNNQDRSSHPMCTTGDCTSIWKPLTVKAARPTAGRAVSGKVASVALADGTRQVTWKGMPLYTFSFDHNLGKVTGNGFHDSFGGTSFVWHAAVAKGQMPMHSSGGSGGSSGSGGSGSGSSGSNY